MDSKFGFDTDSDDEIPAGWEERVTLEGKVYYANHNTRATQWEHPATGKKKQITGELPYGWETKLDEDGSVIYVDHINKKTTFTDPRLAYAVEDDKSLFGGQKRDIRQKYDGHTSGLQILQGRDISKKYVIVTGGNSGIGYETANSLVRHGAYVTIACRNMEKAKQAVDKIKKDVPNARLEYMPLDLCSLKSIQEFVRLYDEREWPLHVLVLNAGVMWLPWEQTEDGFERTMQTNYIGNFYLTKLLARKMLASAPARVVVVAAESHRFSDIDINNISPEWISPSSDRDFRSIMAYNRSKICSMLFSHELNNQLWDQGVVSNSVHPGNLIYTGLGKDSKLYRSVLFLFRPFSKSLQQGCATTVYCAIGRELEESGGMYFNNCVRCPPAPDACNSRIAKRLWKVTEEMIDKRLEQMERDTSS
ncbi:WW domain-containing oxidoreductase-like [Lineus longissimus]|uniref:WW domain-containing oxidoreductase-like n=1 Tax=Lineus longissimus TaxID=88925 RepID=UPI002B4E362D